MIISDVAQAALKHALRENDGNHSGEAATDYASPIRYNIDYRKVEGEQENENHSDNNDLENTEQMEENAYSLPQPSSSPSSASKDEDNVDKMLIFTTGSKTYAPHEIGLLAF